MLDKSGRLYALFRGGRRSRLAEGMLRFVNRNIPSALPVFRNFFGKFVPSLMLSGVVEGRLGLLDSYWGPAILEHRMCNFGFLSLLSTRVRGFQNPTYFELLSYSLQRKDIPLFRRVFHVFLGGQVEVRFGPTLARFIATHTDKRVTTLETSFLPATGMGLFTDMDSWEGIPVLMLMVGFDMDPYLRRRLFTEDLHGSFGMLWRFISLVKPVRLPLALFSVLSFYHSPAMVPANVEEFRPMFEPGNVYPQFALVQRFNRLYRARKDVTHRHDAMGNPVPYTMGDLININDRGNWFWLRGMRTVQTPLDDPAVAGSPFEAATYLAVTSSVMDATILRLHSDENYRVFAVEARQPIDWIEFQCFADVKYRYCGATAMGGDPTPDQVTEHVIRMSGRPAMTVWDIPVNAYVKNLSWGGGPSDGFLVFNGATWVRRDGFIHRPFIFYFNWAELASVQHTPLYSVRIVIDRRGGGDIVNLPQGF